MARKDQTIELAGRLREAAKTGEPLARAAVELVRLSIEDLKESLVGADGDDMLRTQGAARHLQRMHKELTVTPPTIPVQEKN